MKKIHLLEQPMFEPMINPRNNKNHRQQLKASKKNKVRNTYQPSFMETKIAAYLEELGYCFVKEKTFPDLQSELFEDVLLPLDFYIRELRMAIEYDGSHHFKLMDGDKKDALDKRILNDKTRDLFCLKRGIKMIRLSAANSRDYKAIILNEIDKLKSKM